MALGEVQKENDTLKRFIDRAGKNIAKQALLLENTNIDLERRVLELELELELANKQPSQELLRSQNDIGELRFYLDQKDEYCSKLLR